MEELKQAKELLEQKCIALKEQKRVSEINKNDRTILLQGKMKELQQKFHQLSGENVSLAQQTEQLERDIQQLQNEAKDRNLVSKIVSEYEEKLEKLKENIHKAAKKDL